MKFTGRAHVRFMERTDIPALARMIGSLFAFMDAPGKFIEMDCIKSFEVFFEASGIDVLVAVNNDKPIGVLGYSYWPSIYSHNEMVFQEMFWWVEPDYRGLKIGKMLLDELQTQAIKRGGARLAVTITKHPTNHGLGQSLGKLGFKESETTHIKELA